MPTGIAFGVLPLVVTAFIVVVVLVLAVVIVSRVVRLARGGPDADRLRQQLLAQHLAGCDSGPVFDRSMLDLQQQIAIDTSIPPNGATPPA